MKRENKRVLHQINFVDSSLLLKFVVTIDKFCVKKKLLSFQHSTYIFLRFENYLTQSFILQTVLFKEQRIATSHL